MSLAEQKEKLHKVIEDADSETTARLIELFQQMGAGSPEFSEDDLAEFNRRSAEHEKDPKSAIPWEESMARIRRKLQK